MDLILDAFQYLAKKQVLQWFVQIFDRTGPTFEQNILCSKEIDTVEPENIESILSTNFAGEINRPITVMSVSNGEKSSRLTVCLNQNSGLGCVGQPLHRC